MAKHPEPIVEVWADLLALHLWLVHLKMGAVLLLLIQPWLSQSLDVIDISVALKLVVRKRIVNGVRGLLLLILNLLVVYERQRGKLLGHVLLLVNIVRVLQRLPCYFSRSIGAGGERVSSQAARRAADGRGRSVFWRISLSNSRKCLIFSFKLVIKVSEEKANVFFFDLVTNSRSSV